MKTKLRKTFNRKIAFSFFFIVLLGLSAFSQTGQFALPRVSLMPDLPTPYVMRDWKEVARKYDEFVFSPSATGQFLPFLHLKSTGTNYPALQPILLDTYVGSASAGNQAEAINIIPAIVGATLVGIDKSNQNATDWVIKAKDFFNKANGQNIYLNGYSSTSGTDWWYDLMPNVFFYQLFSQYPNIPDGAEQYVTIADRWLSAVNTMGASSTPWKIPEMNYRGWKFASMTPNTVGVTEPEAAGTIAWILYHAWLSTKDKKYLTGAQQAMDFLSNQTSNPAYELQLPYGAFIAAKMNAELGTHYNIEKIVNWCFDRNPKRGWGVITGKWNGSDVSGLIGEANDSGNDYAFVMNGFQQAAALVPMVKYDKRFAHDIAKWMLNLSNATRLFYRQYLPDASQDDYAWSSSHDPLSLVAYEALKENIDGKKLFGTGDAKREGWAQTNLGLYGSSHVGYLGAIVETTSEAGILKLDLNKTDFFGENSFPASLVYNPHGDARQFTLALGIQSYDVYEAIAEKIIKTNVSGSVAIDIPSDEAMLLVLVPAGSVLTEENGKLLSGSDIVDFHYGYHFEGTLRIKSLAVADTLAEFKQPVTFYSTIENFSDAVTYHWYVNGILSSSGSNPEFSWTASEAEGHYLIKLIITSGSLSAQDSLTLRVTKHIPRPSVISGFKADSSWYYSGSIASVVCNVVQEPGNNYQYKWILPSGSVVSQNDSLLKWNLPQQSGLFSLSCEVTNNDALKTISSVNVLVKKKSTGVTEPYGYYPLDGNVNDYSANNHHAILQGALPVDDARGHADNAYRFSSGSDIIMLPNESGLNFTDELTLSFWVRLDNINAESFILSHGSWEERWKVSVTPEKKLRWTTKTSSGTRDLDSSFPLQLNRYYHFAVVYSGYTMELYADGVLDSFLPANGSLYTTSKSLTFGRKDDATTNYSLHGSLDEVRIYNKALAPNEIFTLKSLWNLVTEIQSKEGELFVYPNPAYGIVYISSADEIKNVDVWDAKGMKIEVANHSRGVSGFQLEIPSLTGIVILRIQTSRNVFYRKVHLR